MLHSLFTPAVAWMAQGAAQRLGNAVAHLGAIQACTRHVTNHSAFMCALN